MREWTTLKKLIWNHAIGGGGLPDGYTKVKGFGYNSDCYFLITGLKLRGSDTVRFSMVPMAACNVLGCYTSTVADNNYSLYISTASNSKYLRYNGSTFKSRFNTDTYGEQFDIVITPTGSHGMPEGQDDTWDEVDFETTVDMCIGTTAVSASSAKFKGSLIGAVIVDGRFHGIPCRRDLDNVLGYYDTVSEQFYEPELGTPTVEE